MRPALLGGAGVVRSRNNNNRLLENNHNHNHNHNPNHSQSQNQSQNQSSHDSTNTYAVANATPTPRRPLRAKDINCNAMRVPTTGNMPPYDKQKRPLMPTLSAAAKNANRTPLTPRVAGSAPPTVGTPTSRRGKEDILAPVSLLSNSPNITPRSGSRRDRIESPNSTPVGTPTPAPPSTNDSIAGSGLGITGIDRDLPKRPTVSFSPSVSDVGYSKGQTQNGSGDSKFFFASDAKAAAQPSRPPLQSKSSSNFFYANGDSIPNRPQSSSASAVSSTLGEERSQPKFFHVNGTPDLQSTSTHLPPPRPSSVVSSASRTASPRPGAANPGPISPSQRPSSPSKLSQYASISSVRNTPTLPSPVPPRPQQTGRGQSAKNIVLARRASLEAGQRLSHGRSSSVGSADGKLPPAVRKISAGSYESSAPGSPLNLITTSVPLSTPEEVSEETSTGGLAAGFRSPIISPVKTNHSIDELNELAAGARRERKVLDLEITNSSLAAINRTLEREMRKQTAELRRYRRLSRSGRLSIATSASIRTSTDTLSVNDDGEGFALSNMSEEEELEEEEESEEETSDEGSLSPSAMEESDLRHRKRDEKRLQLDLTKHQQLLIDSQRMNQSLKRCLGWTEELINEGRKALEYHVRVSDVELGGRVLAPDEVEGADAEEANNEGMSDIGARILREARQAAAKNGRTSPAWGGFWRDDRDSGIELDGAQQQQMSNSFGLEQ